MRSDVEDAHVGRVGCRVPGQPRAHRQSTCCPPVTVPRRHPLGTRRRNRQMTGNTACAACSLLAPSSPWAPSPDSQGYGPDKQHVYLRTLSRSSNVTPWPFQLLVHAAPRPVPPGGDDFGPCPGGRHPAAATPQRPRSTRERGRCAHPSRRLAPTCWSVVVAETAAGAGLRQAASDHVADRQERDEAKGLLGAERVGGVVAVVADDQRSDGDSKNGRDIRDQLGGLARRSSLVGVDTRRTLGVRVDSLGGRQNEPLKGVSDGGRSGRDARGPLCWTL